MSYRYGPSSDGESYELHRVVCKAGSCSDQIVLRDLAVPADDDGNPIPWAAGDPVPDTVEEAVDLADAGALAPTRSITVRKKAGERYERIVAYDLGEKPPRLEDPDNLPEPAMSRGVVGATYGILDDEIPF